MLTATFRSLGAAAVRVFKEWRSMVLAAIIYAAFLGALYFFVLVREASLFQVVITFALAVAAPILFFLLQALIAGAVSTPIEEAGVGVLVKRSLASFWKLFLISLPIIALGILLYYLLDKAQNRFGYTILPPEVPGPVAAKEKASPPIDWKHAFVSSIRYLIFGLVLPLTTIHLWLATARNGLVAALKRVGQHLGRAFAPQAVLVYIAGFLIFALVPYLLLFRTIPSSHAWLELVLFVVRLLFVFALTLFGWMTTLKALSLISEDVNTTSADEAGEVVEAV